MNILFLQQQPKKGILSYQHAFDLKKKIINVKKKQNKT